MVGGSAATEQTDRSAFWWDCKVTNDSSVGPSVRLSIHRQREVSTEQVELSGTNVRRAKLTALTMMVGAKCCAVLLGNHAVLL